MKKFDPIDIFFIALISTYFITLICFLVALIYIKIVALIKKIQAKKCIIEKETTIFEKEIVKKPIKKPEELKVKVRIKLPNNKPKFKLSDIALIRKLFMKEKEITPLDTGFEMAPIIIKLEPKKEQKASKTTPKTKKTKKTAKNNQNQNRVKKQNNAKSKQKQPSKKNNTNKKNSNKPKNVNKQENTNKSNSQKIKKRA